jgi:hypothetical protein
MSDMHNHVNRDRRGLRGKTLPLSIFRSLVTAVRRRSRTLFKTLCTLSSKLSSRKDILAIVLASVLVLEAAISGWNYYDIRYFIGWYTKYFKTGQILEIYADQDPTFKVAYPPLAILLFTTMYHIALTLTQNNVLIIFITKLPLLLSFFLAYIVLIRKYNNTLGYLWLINPLTYSIILSFQFDPVVAFLILVALYYLTEKHNYHLYAVFVTLAALIKHAVALFLVVPLIVLIKRKKYSETVKYMAVVVLVAAPILLPFFTRSPGGFLEKVIWFHAKRPPQQLSVWAVPYYYVEYNLDMVPSIVSNIWLPVFLVYLVLVLIMALRENIYNEKSFMLKYTILIISGFFTLSKVVNVTYYLWIIPIVLILLDTIKSKKELYRNLIKLYLFVFLWISSFSFFTYFVPLVTGDDIFIFEDWCQIPSEPLHAQSHSSRFFNFFFMIVIFIRSTPELMRIFNILSKTHDDIMILLIGIHTLFQLYLIKAALKHLNTS